MDEVKKKLKAWELTFFVENNRQPTKIDIDTASDSIKDLYKKYAEMKKEVSENKVWGSDLNNVKVENKKVGKKLLSPAMSRMGLNLSKKILQSDIKSKQLTSFKLKSSTIDNKILDCDTKNIIVFNENSYENNRTQKSINAIKDDIGLNDFTNKYANKDETIVDACNKSSFVNHLSSNNSDFVLKNYRTNFQSTSIIKNKHLIDNMHFNNEQTQKINTLSFDSKHLDSINLTSVNYDFQGSKSLVSDSSNPTSMSYGSLDINKDINSEIIAKNSNRVNILQSTYKMKNDDDSDDKVKQKAISNDLVNLCANYDEILLASDHKKRNAGNIVDNEENVTLETPRFIDNNIDSDDNDVCKYEKDDDVMLKKTNKKRKADSDSIVKNSKKKIIEQEDKTCNVINEKKTVRTKKIPVCNVNKENFVKLNLRVKHYSKKGGAKMSGAKYKRFIWKQRMKNREDNSGDNKQNTNCFKCGQPGHWANKCKGKFTNKNINWTMENSKFKNRNCDLIENNSSVNILEHIDDIDEEVYLMMRQSQTSTHTTPASSSPIYSLQQDGQLPETPTEVFESLKLFGFNSFKANQEKAIMRILCGLSTLVILSTGAGKSLIYQLAAYIYAQHAPCISLIVSPLISLMQDQVLNLPNCVKGAFLNNSQTPIQRASVLQEAQAGRLHFLLLSPEMLVASFISNLPPIAFACIDEVHCLSEWSHHFRPSYLMVAKNLKERYGVQCLLGLTATASHSTIKAVRHHLTLSTDESSVLAGAPIPSNLLLSVSREENKDEGLIELLQGERFSKCQSLIVYCTRREQTAHVAVLIRTCLKSTPLTTQNVSTTKKAKVKKGLLEWDAECYHAGLSAAQRRRIQSKFMSGKLRVVVATVAFGMGIDKQDIRGIIHYNFPKTVEGYIQEVGRAGRDGQPAFCHVFLDSLNTDLNELKRHIYSRSMDRSSIKKLVKHVFTPCKCLAINSYCDDDFDVITQPPMNRMETDMNCENGSHVSKENKRKMCAGHNRALPIEELVQSLDIKEEGISTLLCYLDLHEKKWITTFQPTKSCCKIMCYGGAQQFIQISKKCPPINVVLSRQKKTINDTTKMIEFDFIELADFMGCDPNVIKREISQLQFIHENGSITKSGVMVEFLKQSYHFRCNGDYQDDDIDSIVEFLSERVELQEKTDLMNLYEFYNLLKSVSYKSCISCLDTLDEQRSMYLRDQLQVFLNDSDNCGTPVLQDPFDQMTAGDIERVRGDVCSFLQVHGADQVFTGRSIARIMHGIESPLYPAHVWAKARKFWRSNLHLDFNTIRKIATAQIARLK